MFEKAISADAAGHNMKAISSKWSGVSEVISEPSSNI